MTKLDELIAAVEAGSIARHDLDAFVRWRGLDDAADECLKAYNGSLDAALALHNALLPGWTRDVDATAPECGIAVTLHKPYSGHSHPDEDRAVSADLECESRAWLLAILRAYRETQA